MQEIKVTPQSLGGFIRSLSGLFMTKDNPHGISPKECVILTILRSQLDQEDKVVTKEVREYISNELNQTYQLTINYLNKFKKKGILKKTGQLHPIFYKNKITIEYGQGTV